MTTRTPRGRYAALAGGCACPERAGETADDPSRSNANGISSIISVTWTLASSQTSVVTARRAARDGGGRGR
eukprot:31157-Pelagococcus_subviridis.AAC.10